MYLKLLFAFLCYLLPVVGWTEPVSVKEMMINVENASLFCRVGGQGTPLVVLHGGPGMSQDYLQPHFWEIAKNHTVIFYDQRAGGKSTGEATVETINIETFVKDLDDLRKALGYEKFSVLGHSWGGFLAMSYAIAHPENVDKLILSNSIAGTSESFVVFTEEYLRRIAPVQKEMSEIEQSPAFAEGDPELFKRYCTLIFSKYCYVPDDALKMNMDYGRECIVKFFKVSKIFDETLLMGSKFNLNPSLNQLKVSTLIIHGDVDVIPYSCAEELNKNIPGSKYILIEKCGHCPFVEQPEQYFEAINDFLR